MPADRLPAAIGDLDPGNRALLDLSLRRGVSDAEIGELLRKEPAEVARGRDAVLELLADALDVGGHDRRERVRGAVAALPDDAWQPAAAQATPPPGAPTQPEQSPQPPARAPEPTPERDRERAVTARELDEQHRFDLEPPRRRRRAGLLALLGLLAVVIALVAVLSSGGDEDEPESGGGNDSPPAQDGGPAPAGSSQKLATVGGGNGSGTLTVTDEGATITIRGLPDPRNGVYAVWLYDSVVSAKSLGTLEDGSGRLEVALPPDADSYRFLDVSLEPADGNPNHSGDSVMRAPLGELLGD